MWLLEREKTFSGEVTGTGWLCQGIRYPGRRDMNKHYEPGRIFDVVQRDLWGEKKKIVSIGRHDATETAYDVVDGGDRSHVAHAAAGALVAPLVSSGLVTAAARGAARAVIGPTRSAAQLAPAHRASPRQRGHASPAGGLQA